MIDKQTNAQERKLLCAARSLLSMQVGMCLGAIRMAQLLAGMGEPYLQRHGIFAEFASAIPAGLPVGMARLYWAPEALLERDAALAQIEARFRSGLLAECQVILRRYKLSVPTATSHPPAPASTNFTLQQHGYGLF